ncbi:MAG: hypothetical protein QM597_04115, partial [Aeromicrobium sp.]|uniref:hypothetical protein n=1 Tax=Aeromicrobium sp. TaxID=1871063 RepID=UPI0039E27C26
MTLPTGVSEIPGRAWTSAYSMEQSGGSSYLKTLNFWLLNDSGYQYALTLRNYNGINSTVEATSLGLPVGMASGTDTADADMCTPSYKSLQAPTNPGKPTIPCAVPYRVFFEEPAADLPVTAPIWDTSTSTAGTQVIKPDPVDPEDVLSNIGLAYTPTSASTAAGTFTYDLGDNFFGGYYLQIDVNGDGDYDDSVDRDIHLGAAGEPIEYDFDGLDGEGNEISACTAMNVRVHLDRIGEVHVVQTDVEGRSIELIRENGPDSPDPNIYWDDTNFTSGTTSDTGGTDSTGGVHGWSYSTSSFGNNRYIDDWSYVEADDNSAELTTPGSCLEVEKVSSADGNDGAAAVGDTVEYTVTATNVGETDFTVGDPAVLVDDLSGVLDVAAY